MDRGSWGPLPHPPGCPGHQHKATVPSLFPAALLPGGAFSPFPRQEGGAPSRMPVRSRSCGAPDCAPCPCSCPQELLLCLLCAHRSPRKLGQVSSESAHLQGSNSKKVGGKAQVKSPNPGLLLAAWCCFLGLGGPLHRGKAHLNPQLPEAPFPSLHHRATLTQTLQASPGPRPCTHSS